MNLSVFSMIQEVDVVILAAGSFPMHPVPLQILEKHRERIICCDGAADQLLEVGFTPEVVIGDGDSISSATRLQLADRLVYDPDQETNDLTKAFRYALKQGRTRICILGATGKREDHTLGNISLLADYMDEAQVEMVTDSGFFTPVAGTTRLDSFPGQQISIFAMDQLPLTLCGLQWPVQNRVMDRWWQATLNEAITDFFEVETKGKILVFRNYE